jgi:hypothetical protein
MGQNMDDHPAFSGTKPTDAPPVTGEEKWFAAKARGGSGMPRGVPENKRCSHCHRWLPAEAFRVEPVRSELNPWRHWRLSSWCRECQREATRRWYEANRERLNAERRAEYAAARGPLPRCSECEAELDSHAKVVCSRRCKDARYRRLHPAEFAAARRRHDQRVRERKRAAG